MFKKTKVCTGLMLAFGGSLGLSALPVLAQQQLDKVEITGSSIKRIDAEGVVPVQVVTREEISRSGVTSTEQLLAGISAASSSGGTANATGAGSSTYGASTISLHGLGEERTLVLVNGRRLASFSGTGTAAVNVNSIPLAAIDRVEVLKDGASGVYGSDAIAGVVNFILSKDFQGFDLSGTTGKPTRAGGGKNNGIAGVFGFGDMSKDRYNLTVSASQEKETPLFAKDRSYSKTGNQDPYISAAATGQGNIQGGYTPGTGSAAAGTWVEGRPATGFGNPTASYGNPLAAANDCASINMFLNVPNSSKGLPYCTFDSPGYVGLIPKRELTNLSANGAFKFSDSVELFGDALYSKSVVTQKFQPSPIRRSFLQTDLQFAAQGVDPVLLLLPSNPNYAVAKNYLLNLPALPAGATAAQRTAYNTAVAQAAAIANANQPLGITARVFDFGLRTSEDTAKQTRLVAGTRGTVFGQDYEVAFSQNKSTTSGTVPDGYFSQVAYAKVINSPTSDWNPWSLTQSAAFNAALAAAGAKYTGGTLEAVSQSNGIDAKVSGDLFDMPAGKSQYAVGGQYRIEKYETTPSAALGTGDIAGLGGATAPVDRSRKIASLFGELNLPILKTLEGNLALRGDKYQGVGQSANYKGSLRWTPAKEMLVRGSLGSSFRAPTLADLWTPQTLGTSEQFNDPTGPSAATDLQVNSINGGKSDIKPEKATQSTIGIVLAPTANFTAGFDWFNVNVKNYIQTPSAQLLVSRFRAGDPAYQGLVTLDSSGEVDTIDQRLSNTGGSKVSGIDVDLRWRESFGSSKLNVGLLGTYMIKFDETTPSGAISHKVGTIVDSTGAPVAGADSGGVVLRWKHVLTGTWTTGPWGFTLTQNYSRGYEAGHDLNDERVFMPEQAIYDANVAFSGVKNLRLALGVRNLFNKDPAIFTPASNQFQAGYDITQYDPRGRFVYLTAGYKF